MVRTARPIFRLCTSTVSTFAARTATADQQSKLAKQQNTLFFISYLFMGLKFDDIRLHRTQIYRPQAAVQHVAVTANQFHHLVSLHAAYYRRGHAHNAFKSRR